MNFPQETEGTQIFIEGNNIICKSINSFYNCKIETDKLEGIFLVINAESNIYSTSNLFLNSPHHCWIPTNAIGFKNAYNFLSQKFDLDNEAFFRNVNNTKKQKFQIWRKNHKTNYSIVDLINNDIGAGFEIQAKPKEFISWDITYEKLALNPNTYFSESDFKHKILKFHFPVRVGNIVFNDLFLYFDNPRLDVPVQHFNCECFLEGETDESYFELKQALIDVTGNSENFYERADQNSFVNDFKGIKFSLTYWYDTTYSVESFYTSFTIKNRRKYPSLLDNRDYNNKISIDKILVLERPFSINPDYIHYPQVKSRPEEISKNYPDQPVIWNDFLNSIIGFSAEEYCLMFKKEEILSINIQNIQPARGQGGSNLIVTLYNNERINVLYGKYKEFMEYISEIAYVTQNEVIIDPESYDD
jgi:hypothetical protein